MKWKVAQLCLTLWDPFIVLGQNTGVGSLFLLKGIFPNPGIKPRSPHCRQIPYQLSHQGKPNDNQQRTPVVNNSLNDSHGCDAE